MHWIATSLQMCNYKYIWIHNTQVSKEITLKYILVYYNLLSVYSEVHFNHISKKINYKITYNIKVYFSPTYVKKSSNLKKFDKLH